MPPGQVEHDPPDWKIETRIGDCRCDPVPAFLDRSVRQADDVEGTESDGNIDFHIHRMGINSEYRSRIRFGNHSSGLAVDSFCLLFLLYYLTIQITVGGLGPD